MEPEPASPALPGPKYFNPVAFARSLPDPTDWMLAMRQKFGDTFEVPRLFGRIVVSGDPEVARAVFTADPDTFLPFRPDLTAPFVGDTSLVLVSGAWHRRDRKLLAPPFNGARMRAYGSVMARSAERAAAAWKQGDKFKVLDVTQRISLDVILQAVFGLDHEAGRTREVEQAVIDFIAAISPWFVFVSGLRRNLLGLSPWARFQKRAARLDALLYDEIARRRSEGGERDDILSLMMSARYDDGSAMSDKELRDELLTLLFAGHETTAIGLAWAFYWLHRDPAELSKVLAEIDALGPAADWEAVAALPYLDAVCQESLRLHPIQPDIPRLLAKPFEVAGPWAFG
jgi:cytochrome P450